MSQPGQNQSQQPISFKTVPGRNRTQKWTQAKTNNYDGDDWGGYDDYDDYGGYQEPSSAQQSGPQLQRQSSFDRGVDAERRQFSSGTAIYEPEPERYTSPNRGDTVTSQDGRSPDDSRRRMREFSNPGQVPQPLNTPRSPVAVPGSVERPPRKSSLVSGSPPPGARATPAIGSPVMDKPLPFVRPSDIYKRMAEEQQKERQSMESGRPSMDSIKKDVGSPSTSGRRPSLEPVHEPKESDKPMSPEISLPAVAEGSAPQMAVSQPSAPPTTHLEGDALRPKDSRPSLPPVSRVSDFGSFMPRDEEEERISATGLAAAANAATLAMTSTSRDVTPTMPAHQSQTTMEQPIERSDPAADIAAERATGAPAEQLGRTANEDPSGLSHQPSSGFRSVVHKAFDRQDKAFDRQGDSVPASPISRDNTQSAITRSDTNSTASISPIMSRVPSAATAQQRQQERDAVVPPIAEETPLEVARSRPAQDSSAPAISSRPSILRKPTPSHSRNVSSEVAGFTPGYRRSMNTPSPNNSPARTPGLGEIDTRRLSGPMSAVPVNNPEAPDVDPAAPEMPSATLEPVETPLETPDALNPGVSDVIKPLPTTGRGRSGTDYSLREADLAREANASPEDNKAVAEAATAQQNLFLDTHPSNPGSPTTMPPTMMSPSGFARPFPRPATSGSGRSSPAGNSRSRVRNIVDQFHQIDEDSRRNSTASHMSSKSSWSNFGADEEVQPGLNRRTTGGSALSQQTPGESPERGSQDAGLGLTSPPRPGAERLESFKPHLPGEWISAAPTPADEVPSPMPLGAERGRDHTTRDITPVAPPTPKGQPTATPDEEIDLTPTTRKTKLRGSEVDESESALAAAKNAGEALGTAFMSSVGYGHQTRDFASKEPAVPVDVPEMQPHRPTGNIEHLNLPILQRGNSDAPSDGTNSVANSVPPTPPAKDTPQPPGLAANAGPAAGRPVSNYFAGATPDAPAPLSFGKHSPNNSRDFAASRPTVLPSLSTDTSATDFESDRLRKDIVRSLGPERMAEIKREGILEDTDRTQDALDAPANEHKVASGELASPAAEIKSSDARSGLPSQARPGLLGQRFSWENRPADSSDHLYDHMAVVGETKGDEDRQSYERPRSNQGLHVVNTQVVADSEPSTAETDKQIEPHFMLNEPADAEKRLSSALPIGTAALALGSLDNSTAKDVVSPVAESPDNSQTGLENLAPTPMVEDIDEAARSAESQSPSVSKEESSSASSAPVATAQTATPAQGKIPAFRDLAAIKNTDERIAGYETTRRRFADMNTGLTGWLSGMLNAHPEYANAGNQKYEGPAVIQTAGLSNTISGLGGTIKSASHKHSPSILKIGGERKPSTTSTSGTTPTTSSGGGHADVEKMQAKGKDFMKSAGAGAKGLFAKGKSRFGRSGEKASSSSTSVSTSSPLVIAPAFAASTSGDSSKKKDSHKPGNVSQPSVATAEKAPSSAGPIPSSVSDDTMHTDRTPTSASTTASDATERPPRSVFGRLKDASRSAATSRSRSRPGSVVFGTGYGDERKSPAPSRTASMILSRAETQAHAHHETEPTPAMPALEPLAPIENTLSSLRTTPPPSQGPPGSLGALPEPFDRRREAWEHEGDSEAAGAYYWRDENGRLGVLPSPSVQESVGPGSPGGARKGSWIGEVVESPVVEERREEEERLDKEKEAESGVTLPSTVEGKEPKSGALEAKVSPAEPTRHDGTAAPAGTMAPSSTAISTVPDASESEPRRSSLDNDKVRRPSVQHAQSRSASFVIPAASSTRPEPVRKLSALDQLPSQQRRRQFTPVATPRRMSLADDGAGSAPLDDLEPMPIDRPTSEAKASRPVTPAKWDLLSMAAEPEGGKDADDASRRSSVSSLDEPHIQDAVAVPGAASKRQSVVGVPVGSVGGIVGDGQQRNVSPLPVHGDDLGDGQLRNVSPLPVHGNAPEHSQQRNVSPLPIHERVGDGGNDGQQYFVSPLLSHEGFGSTSGPPVGSNYMPPGSRFEDNRLTNRDSHSTQQTDQRPMSYAAHSRGSSNVMLQDATDAGQVNKRYSYQPHQSLQPPSRAPSIMQLPSEYDKLRSPQAGDLDPAPGGSSSNRSSGFFRGPDIPGGGPGMIPSPSKLDANYDGLIDPQVSEIADEIAKAEQPQPQRRRKSGIMDSFRRSSTLSGAGASHPSSRGSSPKVVATNVNESSLAKTKTLKKPQRASSSAVDPPKNKRFSGLGSLFRRSSTMTPRSSTQADAQAGAQTAGPQNAAVTPKASKKLTKTQTPQQQQQQQLIQQQQMQQQRQQSSQRPATYHTAPPPGDYAAYEAMMRQHAQSQSQYLQQQQQQQRQQQRPMYSEPAMMSSPYQQQPPAASDVQQSGYYNQGQPQTQYQQSPPQGRSQQYQTSAPNSRTHSLVGSPINEQGAPFEYYGSPQGQSPPPSQSMPQPRRLHSEGHWRRDTAPVPGIPEANSPIDSSNSTSFAPVRSYTDGQAGSASVQGSPQHDYSGPARPTLETRQSSTYSQSSVVRSPVMAQQPDNFPQAPGRQDYQTQYWQHQHKPQREPTLPQLQTHAPAAHMPTTSVGSIDQQMARSPAMDYQDQQTPWAISLPQEGSNRNSGPASWTQQHPGRQPSQQYRGPPAAARGAVRPEPPHQGYEEQYSVMPQQRQNTAPQGQQRHSFYGEQISSPTSYTPASSYQSSSPTPYTPASPRGQEYGSFDQYNHRQPQQQRSYPPQNRYYTQGPPRPSGPQEYVGQNNEGRPLSYQRTPSGYSGRRDDAAVSEAELMNMRSTSYPGQEWVPGRN